jgi:hypothetical protein
VIGSPAVSSPAVLRMRGEPFMMLLTEIRDDVIKSGAIDSLRGAKTSLGRRM